MTDKCICGNDKFREFTKQGVTVDERGNSQETSISLGECQSCGLARQLNIPFQTEQQYSEYYRRDYPPVKASYSKKDYRHDRELAVKRYDVYQVLSGNNQKILDVGSGSGAFVDECRQRGMEAYGCEIARYNYVEKDDYIYHDRLENIYFPTDHFDFVTCHDTAEHVLNPVSFVSEMFRALKQGGTCIIDMPRFFHKSGEHHWKDIEHIWYFTTEQFKKILKDVGFTVIAVKHPIESKTVFYATKPTQKRPTILMPPGMGDAYWSIIKLQAFLKDKSLGLPDVLIAANRDNKWEGHKRSFPFLEMFPFLKSTGENVRTGQDPKKRRIWKEAYNQKKRTIFNEKAVLGCDYFIAYNGHLRVGECMENIDRHLKTNWYPPMFVSLEQEKFRKECIKKYGKYIVFYFPFYGTFQHWTKEFSIKNIIDFICQVIKQTGYIPIFTGAKWDADEEANKGLREVMVNIPGKIDLTGKTSIEQLFGLLRGSEMVVGYPSGLTIMSAVLKKKTLIIWNNFYNASFAWHSCPPDVKNITYFIEFTKNLTPHSLTEKVIKIITGQKIKSGHNYPAEIKATEQDWEMALGRFSKKNIVPSARDISRNDPRITIMCVLKSGGDFTVDYVVRLQNMIARNTTVPYKFICLTDMEIPSDICENVKLKHNYNRQWSKIELFRPDITEAGRIIYLGLDIVVTGNIDNILTATGDFIALKPWNKRNQKLGLCASGLMAFRNNGAFSFIYDQFKTEDIGKYPKGDQEYISGALAANHKNPVFWQDIVNGIYSYKRQCRQGIPGNARVVCFHGRPRPHQVDVSWVKENWI